MALLLGYARVSTTNQKLDLQLDALKKYGVLASNIYQEKASGANKKRPVLQKLLEDATEGDTIVIYKLCRLGRSMAHLIEVADLLEKKKVELVSVQDSISTATPQGRLFFHIVGSLAEFERELTKERILDDIVAAKNRNVKFGRPTKLDGIKLAELKELANTNPEISLKQFGTYFNVSRSTVYRALNTNSI